MKSTPEHLIEEAILNLLMSENYYCFKVKDQSKRVNGNYRKNKFEINGVADIVVFLPGKVLWIEVKNEIGKQSKAQIEFERQVNTHDGFYTVVRTPMEALEYVKLHQSKLKTAL